MANEVPIGEEADALRKIFANMKHTMMQAEMLLERMDGNRPLSPRHRLASQKKKTSALDASASEPATPIVEEECEEDKPEKVDAEKAKPKDTQDGPTAAALEMVRVEEKA